MKKLLSLFLGTCLFCNCSFARRLKGIHVRGQARIETETIINELPVKIGQEYGPETASGALKILNRTGYFADVNVTINTQDDVMYIDVVENPVINRLAYEGMKFSVRDALRDVIKIKERQVFSAPAVHETQQMILECYRRQGYLNARVTPKIVKLPDNRVDLVFEVFEGSPAYVRKVAFVGNKAFSGTELREIMSIRAKQWFHLAFLGGGKNRIYDPEKFTEDQQNIIKFYLNRGYADIEIVSATAELSPNKRDFFLTYFLREGEIYKFGDLSVDCKIPKLDAKSLQASIMAKKGAVFNGAMVEVCQDILRSIVQTQGYTFAVVEPVFKKNAQTKTVDICFTIKDGPRITIEKINIKGNFHTRDNVIRRELRFVEGDPFDHRMIKNAEERIKSLDFFKNVRIEVEEGSTPQQAVITVNVEENKTGEVFAKGGYSTLDKLSIEGKIFDPNFRGKAQTFETSVSYARKTFECTIGLSDPYFLGRDLYGSASLFHTRARRWTAWTRTKTGGEVGLGYRLSRNVTQHWGYILHRENISENDKKKADKARKVSLSASEMQNAEALQKWWKTDEGKEHKNFMSFKEDVGSIWGSAVTHTVAYDCRDRRMLPSRGFRVAWTTKVSGLGGGIRHLINTWSGSWHHRIVKDCILNLRASFSHACGLGDTKLRVVDSLMLGGENFRGFDFYGISPARGFAKEAAADACDNFFKHAPDLDYLDSEDKKFVADNKDAIKASLIGDKEWPAGFAKKWGAIARKSAESKQPDVLQLSDITSSIGHRLGATLSWTGSIEIVFPMPILPRDSEVFGTVFVDLGSAWRSKRKYKNLASSVINDDHYLRVSGGLSAAWNSPFGLLSIGYARPFRKSDNDDVQKFLFGYGMRFS